ncbi:hypothetical protein CKA32_001910 [Geitlerinema sp. FC II]|nr:hypothetical protein CKA32_001910 [Geitlerinema sp. FC II]
MENAIVWLPVFFQIFVPPRPKTEDVFRVIRNPNLNASTSLASTSLSVESERSRGLKHWFFPT